MAVSRGGGRPDGSEAKNVKYRFFVAQISITLCSLLFPKVEQLNILNIYLH